MLPDEIKNKTWVKVLDKDGNSLYGGYLKWSLPNGIPGEWHEVKDKIICCENGLHFTCDPKRWIAKDCRFFIAELDFSEYDFENNENDDKICVRRGRLVRELPHEELYKFNIYYSGNHEVVDGLHYASDNATVMASDNATVDASDNATVEASGNATVRAWGNATVRASDNATVEASGNATVDAWDNVTVKAWGNATVRAWDNATVMASDNATVRASGNATVRAWGNATVRAWGNATVRASGTAYLFFYNNEENHTVNDSAIMKSHDNRIWMKKGSHQIIEI